MAIFNVSVPFAGEAVSVFKSVTDLFSYGDFGKEKITHVSDDTSTFSFPVTLGVFRLLLDGECVVVDRDFDSHVSLLSVTSRDRGGKGKIDARIRLSLQETAHASTVECECDVTTKGMLARVELPLEEVMSDKIRKALTVIIEESGNAVEVDAFAQANKELGIDITPEIVVTPLETSGRDKPVWVAILQFPANLVLYPISLLRSLFL